jgi:methyl-accepting chemotaxis protein
MQTDLTLREAADATGKSTHILRRAMLSGRLAHRRDGDASNAGYITTVEALLAAGYELRAAPTSSAPDATAAEIERLRRAIDDATRRAEAAEARAERAEAHADHTTATVDALMGVIDRLTRAIEAGQVTPEIGPSGDAMHREAIRSPRKGLRSRFRRP